MARRSAEVVMLETAIVIDMEGYMGGGEEEERW